MRSRAMIEDAHGQPLKKPHRPGRTTQAFISNSAEPDHHLFAPRLCATREAISSGSGNGHKSCLVSETLNTPEQ